MGGNEENELSSQSGDENDKLNLKVTKDNDHDSVEDLVAMGLAA